jgi:hypothetical protein
MGHQALREGPIEKAGINPATTNESLFLFTAEIAENAEKN